MSLGSPATLLGELLGGTPFPWQLALLDRMLRGELPSALDVPTGLGKTAVMAIWLVARAAGAPVPRRLVYVVDRRAVVDQATAVAEGLREWVDGDLALKAALQLEGALPISTLRGKFVDNRAWLRDPSAPAIVLGTVDMVGSRLLFEGYAVSRRMRPYHAGMLGADALVALDEAHLVAPFERLLESIAGPLRARLGPHSDVRGIVPSFSLLSLSATGRARPGALALSDADRANETVSRRLAATKRLRLRSDVAAKELPERLADEAWELSERGTKALRCIVFCNRRDDAQAVRDGLLARAKKAAVGVEAELFVGARRVYEREAAARWLGERGFIAGDTGTPTLPTFVVATSAGEVGVDLDADHMVSDLVAWERMVQRLGRVNRRGDGDAWVIVVPAIAEKPKDGDLERLDAVRAVIAELPRKEGELDASPGAITALKARATNDPRLAEKLTEATTPDPLHPPLHRAVVESWSMTSIEEHTGRPEVAPWLRGWVDDDDPQTTVVWREQLPVTEGGRLLNARDLAAFREAADPHLAERLETETYRVLEWLSKRLGTLAKHRNDERPAELVRDDVAAVVFDGRGEPRTLTAHDVSDKDRKAVVERALEGAVLIVDVRVGGLAAGLLDADAGEALDVTTMGEPRVVPFRVTKTASSDRADEEGWRAELRVPVAFSADGEETEWLLVESSASGAAESEEGRSVAPRHAQLLDEHESWAEREAKRTAERLGLPPDYALMLALSARLHDEGKRARNWQRAFGVSVDELAKGIAYGKTTSRPNIALLGGYRHEFGSLPRAQADERLQALEPALQDLCLHLIAAHHGNARPFVRTDGAEEPPSVLQERAQEVALRFARMEKRWGPWGLAWWEALLRAADQQASRLNDEGGPRG